MTPLLLLAVSLFTLDPAKTEITRSLGAALHTVHGTFRIKSAAPQSGQIVIDATSGQSGNTSRDAKMHKTVLESAKYPEIVFTPKRIDGPIAPTGSSEIKLIGDIQIHGATHQITIPARVEDARRFTATFTIPYVAWGMKSPSTFLLKVDDKVGIAITGEGKLVNP